MKPQYHVSGLEKLSKCGVDFENTYLLRRTPSRSVSMVTGSAVDRSISADLENQMNTGELLPLDAVREIARDALVGEWRDGSEIRLNNDVSWKNGEAVVASEEDIEDGVSAELGATIDAVVDLAGFHHQEVAPIIGPTHVQRRFVLDVEGLDIQVAGAMDIVEGLARIRDSKCSAKSPAKDLAHKSIQLSMYAMATKVLDGDFPKIVQLDKLVRTPKRKDLKYIPLESTRGPADMPPLLARIEAAAKVVNSGIFTPAPADSWQCGPKYCPWFKTCPFAMRPVSVMVNGSK